jgi:hypothetical protein
VRRAFDRYMIAVGAGRHPKLRDLTINQRYVFFTGVLSVAAESPRRGFLMVGERQANGRDIAAACGADGRLVARTLERCRAVGLVETDPDTGFEFVHDWWDYNPDPRVDATNAERQRRYRERQRNASRNTSPVTSRNALEVEVEVEEPPLKPPPGRNATRNGRGSGQRQNPRTGRGQGQAAPGDEGLLVDPAADRDLVRRQNELCSHFPGYPRSVVINACRELSEPGSPATIADIRAYLKRPL